MTLVQWLVTMIVKSGMDVGQPQGPTMGTTNTSIASGRGDEARIRGRGRGRGTSRIKTSLKN